MRTVAELMLLVLWTAPAAAEEQAENYPSRTKSVLKETNIKFD